MQKKQQQWKKRINSSESDLIEAVNLKAFSHSDVRERSTNVKRAFVVRATFLLSIDSAFYHFKRNLFEQIAQINQN